MAAVLSECSHHEELTEMWGDFPNTPHPNFCGEYLPHPPHDSCMGIFCDFGCNAEDF